AVAPCSPGTARRPICTANSCSRRVTARAPVTAAPSIRSVRWRAGAARSGSRTSIGVVGVVLSAVTAGSFGVDELGRGDGQVDDPVPLRGADLLADAAEAAVDQGERERLVERRREVRGGD